MSLSAEPEAAAFQDLELLTQRQIRDVLGPQVDAQPLMITVVQLQQLVGSAWIMGAQVARNNAKGRRTCRICGCWQLNACPGGCSWVEANLCSACAPAAALTCEEV